MRTSQRRHADEKVLNRRLRFRHHWITLDERLEDKDRARWYGIIRNTGTTCSCWMCKRSRRYYGPSVQERRQIAWIGGNYEFM